MKSVLSPSVQVDRFSCLEASKAVKEFFDGTNSQLELLITGSSGVGKSSLVHRARKRSRSTFKALSPAELSDDEAGTVETNIVNAFNPNIFLGEKDSTVFHVVFIDDIDIWAPARITSPLHSRIIATLNEIIQDLVHVNRYSEHFQQVRFIATASSIESVHPSLVRSACIHHIICLSALSHFERQSWCLDALKCLYTHTDHRHELSSLSHTLASITPGFVHSDMLRLFSSLLRHAHDPQFPSSPSDLVHSALLRKISRSFTPSLLSEINPLLTCIPFHGNKIYGMHSQLTHMKQCLNAVFSNLQVDSTESGIKSAIHALKSIRTLTGVLIHGPTGCGKSTLVQQATQALPTNAVNVLPLDSASIMSSVIGQAERNLSSIFSVARMIAPTVVIIENIDVLAAPREESNGDSSSSSESFSRILSTLLVQIDGIQTDSKINNPPVLVIGTTRDFSLIDPALLRPGRIDVHIAVQLPDEKERYEIIENMLSKSLAQEHEDKDYLVRQSEGWTTADVIAFIRNKT